MQGKNEFSEVLTFTSGLLDKTYGLPCLSFTVATLVTKQVIVTNIIAIF